MRYHGSSEEQLSLGEEKTVFGCYKNHLSSRQHYSGLTIFESIRRLHPDKHVTVVYPWNADPLKYAQAGHAEASLVQDGGEYFAARRWIASPSRVDGGEGALLDDVFFGLYDYVWKGHKLQVYDLDYPGYNGRKESAFYILTPKENIDSDGQCPIADALLKAAGKWNLELHDDIYVFDNGGWSKSKPLYAAVQAASWDDVILDQAMKNTLIKDIEDFFDSSELYREYGVPWKRGIIFYGTPGCGKTISIKALMKTLAAKNVASLYVKSLESCNGMQNSIRSIFQQARRATPCMLVFEDLDSLIVDKVRSYFLNEVDGLEDNDGILMIGSTNHLSTLDPAISKRPSRFDRKYHFSLPGERERMLYCQYWRAKLVKNNKVEFPEDICQVVAQLTDGFSYAYLKELFVQTLLALVGGRGADDDLDEVAVTNVADRTKIADNSASLLKGDEKLESTAELGADAAKSADEATKPQRTMPEVQIPDHLESNPLMRILHKQSKALWKDMDSTTDDIHNRKKVK